jgi:hypothetical protein
MDVAGFTSDSAAQMPIEIIGVVAVRKRSRPTIYYDYTNQTNGRVCCNPTSIGPLESRVPMCRCGCSRGCSPRAARFDGGPTPHPGQRQLTIFTYLTGRAWRASALNSASRLSVCESAVISQVSNLCLNSEPPCPRMAQRV